MSWEERINTSYDAEHIGAKIEGLTEELKRIRVILECTSWKLEKMHLAFTEGTYTLAPTKAP